MLTEQEPTTDLSLLKGQGNDEFWDLLLAHIEEGNVVPVIGPEVLTLDQQEKNKTFYRLVAEELLKHFEVKYSDDELRDPSDLPCYTAPVQLRRGFELVDAVCAISKIKQKPLDEFHVVVNKIIKQFVAKYQNSIPKSLLSLASIETLSLFVSTTSDDLLARAINLVRHEGLTNVCEIEYAPNLSSDKIRDLPENWKTSQGAVFYLFGKTSAGQSNAIHEEDMLEWVYNLQRDAEAGPENLLKLIRGKHLLFIGCPLNDWLGRFLLRTSNSTRLVDRRENYEFVVFDPVSMDPGFRLFLERFSTNSKLCYDKAGDFIDELLRRWRKIKPPLQKNASLDLSVGELDQYMVKQKPAIFISYASQDYKAAKKLCQQLQAIAGDDDIAWLDKDGGLTAGDEWENVIRRTISKDCKLFIPLISRHTQQRNEGVFRKEWAWAIQRDTGILGKSFIIPLKIDQETVDTPQDKLLINERFKELHMRDAVDGDMSDDLLEEFKLLIRKLRRNS